jgi:adenylate cyclase
VLEHHTAESFPHMDEIIFAFAEAVAHYRNRSWERAARLFTDILKACPADRPSQLYLERCEIYRKNPPPADWDGVWALHAQ